jgi:uncharacterized protein DUF4019
MSTTYARVARALALALATCGIVAASSQVLAQDPQGAAAQKAARDWLAITDNADALASWNAAGAKFKEAMSVKQWDTSLKQARAPFGALGQRAALSTSFSRKLDGAPEGDYALIQFRTTFANKIDSRETVTLERDADGAWLVIGYVIH